MFDLGKVADGIGQLNHHIGVWEHFGYENPPNSGCEDCPHGRTEHLTRAPSRLEPYYCSECECRQYRGADYAIVPPLGERSAEAIRGGHHAIGDVDSLIADLHVIRDQLVKELRQNEDIQFPELTYDARARKADGQ